MSLPAILVVDDQSSNLIAMEAVFDGEPVELVMASSGQEALKLLLQRDFALVLLDVQMPDLDGFEVAEIMHSNPRTESVPVIFLTAINKEERYIHRGYESGAVDYLFKPIEPEILRSKVRVFLELERKNRSLRESLRLLQEERDHNQTLLRSLAEGLLGVTQHGHIFYANPRAEAMLAASLNDLIGQPLQALFQQGASTGAPSWSPQQMLAACAAGERAQPESVCLKRGEQWLTLELAASPLLPDMHQRQAMKGAVVMLRECQQLPLPAAPEAVVAPERDALTGLYTRAEFERMLGAQVAEANRRESSLALLYVDLDRFQGVNDSHGRAAGDKVLQAAAQRLQDNSRDSDLVARLQADEFVLMLESREPRRAASLVSGKILQAFARVVDVGTAKVQVGASIGIAIYPDDSTHAEDLLQCADKALLQAKGSGRSNYRFYRG